MGDIGLAVVGTTSEVVDQVRRTASVKRTVTVDIAREPPTESLPLGAAAGLQRHPHLAYE